MALRGHNRGLRDGVGGGGVPPWLGISRFYHDSLSCWFFHSFSCASWLDLIFSLITQIGHTNACNASRHSFLSIELFLLLTFCSIVSSTFKLMTKTALFQCLFKRRSFVQSIVAHRVDYPLIQNQTDAVYWLNCNLLKIFTQTHNYTKLVLTQELPKQLNCMIKCNYAWSVLDHLRF